jgi:hypothetical protein
MKQAIAAEREQLHRETAVLRAADAAITDQKRAALDAERRDFRDRIAAVAAR